MLDGRLPFKAFSASTSQSQILLRIFGVLSIQSQFNGKDQWDCRRPSVDGAGTGAFTRSKAEQKIYLYTACYKYGGGGSTDRLQGIAVMEKGIVVRNVFPLNDKFQGYSLAVTPDLNQDGVNEIMTTNGYAHMGQEASFNMIFTTTPGGVQPVKGLDGNTGSCSSGRPDASDEAVVYWVKPGKEPQFFSEVYTRGCGEGEGAGSFRLLTTLKVIR